MSFSSLNSILSVRLKTRPRSCSIVGDFGFQIFFHVSFINVASIGKLVIDVPGTRAPFADGPVSVQAIDLTKGNRERQKERDNIEEREGATESEQGARATLACVINSLRSLDSRVNLATFSGAVYLRGAKTSRGLPSANTRCFRMMASRRWKRGSSWIGEAHWLALETQAAPASNHREGLVTQGCVFQRDSSIQCDTEFWFISNFGQSIYDSWLVTGKVCFPTRAINPTRHSFRDLFRTLGGRNRWYVKILWNLLSIEFEQRRSWIAKGDKTLGSARIEGKGEEKVCVRCRRTVVSSVLAR